MQSKHLEVTEYESVNEKDKLSHDDSQNHGLTQIGTSRDRHINVLFAPWYVQENPYQKCLSECLERLNVSVEGTNCSASTLLKTVKHHEADIVHLHWLKHFYIKDCSWAKASLKLMLFVAQLQILRWKGVKIVWTVHNLHNHQNRHARLDRLGSWLVSKIAHVLIAHSQTTKASVAEEFDINDTQRIKVVTHASYIGSYLNNTDRQTARKALKLPNKKTIFLALGTVEAYKGIPELVRSFSSFDCSESFLLIAGRTKDEHLRYEVESAIGSKKNIRYIAKFIPDNDVQLYMNACDVVALPYQKFLTSGAVSLAMSFGKACIAPNIGYISEMLDSEGAFLYNPSATDGLREALCIAYQQRLQLELMGQHNLAIARQQTWEAMAKNTYAVYRSCFI